MTDSDLGMGRTITARFSRRRCDWRARARGGVACRPGRRRAGAGGRRRVHPPALMGMRAATMRRMRRRICFATGCSAAWSRSCPNRRARDLVVVGGGIVDAAAALFFANIAGRASRILILDNHDDFGGHARRNEFTVGGRLLVGSGGTMLIEIPRRSDEARRLMTALGIDPAATQAFDRRDLLREERARARRVLRSRDVGRDHLAVGLGRRPWLKALAQAPLSDPAGETSNASVGEHRLPPGVSTAAKKRAAAQDRLRRLRDEDRQRRSRGHPRCQTIT